MKTLMWLIPCLILVLVAAWKAYRAYSKGLFMALLYLGGTVLAAIAAFYLTRSFVDPASIDLFGLGETLLEKVPEPFFLMNPDFRDTVRALPTAIAALIVFSALFGVIRAIINRFLKKRNKKQEWSEKYLQFTGNKLLALFVGIVTSLFILVMHMVPLGGVSALASNALQLADRVVKTEEYSAVSQAVHGLADSPAIQVVDAGSRSMFCALTAARRGEEEFSVGEELLELSDAFNAILSMMDVLPVNSITLDADAIRALPDALCKSPAVLHVTAGMARVFRQELTDSDTIYILSKLSDTSPDQFDDYFAQLTPEATATDLTTFCNIAAILSEQNKIPQPGGIFDQSVLNDPQLKAQVKAELLKNPPLAEHLGITAP